MLPQHWRNPAEIFSEGNRDGGRPASMNHENAYPAIEKTQERIVGLTDVSILSSDLGHAVGQFGVNKRSNQCEQAARRPSAKNHCGRVHQPRDNVGVDEYPGADDATHHNHSRVEDSQASSETGCEFRRMGLGGRRIASWSAL